MKESRYYKNNPFLLVSVILLLGVSVMGVFGWKLLETPEQRFLNQYHQEVKDCATAKGLAEREVRAGRLTLLVRPPYENDSSKMPYAFYKKLADEYGVTLVLINSCIGVPEDDCFNLVGRLLLEKKYGKDHFYLLYEKMHVAQYGPRKKPKASTICP